MDILLGTPCLDGNEQLPSLSVPHFPNLVNVIFFHYYLISIFTETIFPELSIIRGPDTFKHTSNKDKLN